MICRCASDDLLDLLGPALGTYRPAEPLSGLDLYAEIRGQPDNLGFSNIRGMIGPLPLAGDLAIDRRGARPFVAADLQTGALALDHLIPAGPTWATGRGTSTWSERPFDLTVLERFDGILSMTAASLSRGPFSIEEPALHAELSNGALTLTQLTGTLFGGAFGLSGQLSAGPPTRAMGDLDLVGATTSPALAAITSSGSAISGRLDLGFEGEATGESPAALISSLQGEGLVSIRDGPASISTFWSAPCPMAHRQQRRSWPYLKLYPVVPPPSPP